MQNVVAAFLLALGAWSVEFNEATSRLTMTHAETNVQISGELGFVVDGKDWTVAAPRDAVSHRLALVDPQGEAQGYLVFNADGDRLEVLAYHRTRQFYLGEVSFRGDVVFRDDSFPCRTRSARFAPRDRRRRLRDKRLPVRSRRRLGASVRRRELALDDEKRRDATRCRVEFYRRSAVRRRSVRADSRSVGSGLLGRRR